MQLKEGEVCLAKRGLFNSIATFIRVTSLLLLKLCMQKCLFVMYVYAFDTFKILKIYFCSFFQILLNKHYP